MSEHKTIILPKTMSLVERISGVSREVSEWIKSLEEPFNVATDVIHLAKCERNDKYSYHYIIDRAIKGPEKKATHQESMVDDIKTRK